MTAERMYHVVAIIEKTGEKIYFTHRPDTHDACCTMLKKITPYTWRRIQLEEVTAS